MACHQGLPTRLPGHYYHPHPHGVRHDADDKTESLSASSCASLEPCRDKCQNSVRIRFSVYSVACSGKQEQQAVLVICYFAALLLVCSAIPGAAGIDCFKCVSLNGNNPSCEDPFHNNYSVSILESPCMGGRKGRNGLFPATACIKLADETGETITVRGCALDSGTLNVDTEIIRMSHCGHFWFDDRYVKGCLQSCDDADGCNGGWSLTGGGKFFGRSTRKSSSITSAYIITTAAAASLLLHFLIAEITGTGFFGLANLVEKREKHHNAMKRKKKNHCGGRQTTVL